MARLIFDHDKLQKLESKIIKGFCAYCGKELKDKRRKYCNNNDECYWLYHAQTGWDALKHIVMRRDNFTCQVCGYKNEESQKQGWYLRDGDLAVHHIKPIKKGGAEFDINNCITLCKNCHKEKHKSNKQVDNAKLLKESELFK